MSRPTVNEINVITGESIVREMNDQEYEQHLADKAAYEAEQAAKQVTE